ncbi:MAG: hypothetical protein NC430_12215 [bacterium]|nr:hypothetical protein [bacterium]
MESIITSIISAAATLIVCMINNWHQRKRDERKREAEREQQQANLTAHLEEIIANQDASTSQIHSEIEMVKYQLSELTKRVEKHNNVIERTYELEKRTEIQEEKIRVANHRIEDLETAVNQ